MSVSSVMIRGILWELRSRRLDPAPLLAECKVTEDMIADIRTAVSSETYHTFVRRALDVTGDLIGSAPRLLAECMELAAALEVPADLDPESDEVWEAAESQGEGEVKWQRYGIESHTCLALIRACRASVETGAAVVFN